MGVDASKLQDDLSDALICCGSRAPPGPPSDQFSLGARALSQRPADMRQADGGGQGVGKYGPGIMWSLKDDELRVGGFLSGSAAFYAGARVGDILMSIGDVNIDASDLARCKQQVAVLTTGDIGSEVAPMILRRGLRKVTVSLRRTNEIVQMMRPEQRPDGVVLSQAEA